MRLYFKGPLPFSSNNSPSARAGCSKSPP